MKKSKNNEEEAPVEETSLTEKDNIPIQEQLLKAFIKAISVSDRSFQDCISEDKDLFKLLNDNYEVAKNISSNENIFSFYFISELNQIIANSLNKNHDYNINGYGVLLSKGYYGILKKEFSQNYNNKNLDEIKWIYSGLLYIDNTFSMLSNTSSITYNNANANIKSKIDLIDDSLKSFKNVNDKLSDLEEKVNSFKTTIDNYDKKQIKRESDRDKKAIELNIAIVGIFVAIVSVLFGGTSFLNSTISNLDVKAQKLCILIGIVGLILFDSVFALFYFISRLIDKPIINKIECPTYSPKCYENKKSVKFLFRQIKHRVYITYQKAKVVFWVNFVLMDAIIFMSILYLLTNNGVWVSQTSNGISIWNFAAALVVPIVLLCVCFKCTLPCKDCFKFNQKK